MTSVTPAHVQRLNTIIYDSVMRCIELQIDFFSSPCSDPFGTPNMNTAGETYGTGSRCIEHGQTWTTSADGQTLTNTNGVGCYQV